MWCVVFSVVRYAVLLVRVPGLHNQSVYNIHRKPTAVLSTRMQWKHEETRSKVCELVDGTQHQSLRPNPYTMTHEYPIEM